MKFLSSPLCPLADVAKGGDGEESASCGISLCLDAVSPGCDLGVNCLVELFVSLT